MKREIKFRGRCNDTWYYGDLEYSKGLNRAIIHTYTNNGLYLAQHQVDPDTVGQFTGLHDKNGKEIYEGDIVHIDSWKPDVMQIKFIEAAFCLADANGSFLGDIHYVHHGGVEQCTILGNIYDNPEDDNDYYS